MHLFLSLVFCLDFSGCFFYSCAYHSKFKDMLFNQRSATLAVLFDTGLPLHAVAASGGDSAESQLSMNSLKRQYLNVR